MGNLWRMPSEAEGITGFTRDLGYEIESTLTKKGYDVDINYSSLDKSDGFIITWDYHKKHLGDIMITKNRQEENSLTIDRFWGIRSGRPEVGKKASSPDELRNAATIYDELTGLLEEKFGKPISEHDGRSIYRAPLEQVVAA